MLHRPPFILAIIVLLVPVAHVKAADLHLTGQFAFPSDADPGKAHCIQIDLKLASKLTTKPYQCKSTDTESNGKAIICSASAGGGGYLILPTRKSCDDERQTESAAE